MITVELRRPSNHGDRYHRLATLTVHDDASYDLDDPEGLFPFALHVVVPDSGRGLRRVTFAEDRATWARHLGGLLRTGYLVPVTVQDTRAASQGSIKPHNGSSYRG